MNKKQNKKKPQQVKLAPFVSDPCCFKIIFKGLYNFHFIKDLCSQRKLLIIDQNTKIGFSGSGKGSLSLS